MKNSNKVISTATILFIGARLFAQENETIIETCQKFKAIKLPITIYKHNKSEKIND